MKLIHSNTPPVLLPPRALVPLIVLGAFALAVMLSACAAPRADIEQLALAEAAMARAETSSTAADAPKELQLARGKLAQARQAMSARDYAIATPLAEEAVLDAQVAEAQARRVRAVRAARESAKAAADMQEELNRKTTR